MAPAGVFFAGWGFTNRDWLQRVWSKSAVIVAILCGAVLSAVFSPGLALASVTAFLLSELLDFAVYTPLQSRNWLLAVALSNTIGAAVDSIVFLWLAFGSLDFFLGQFIGKSYITLLFIGGMLIYRKSIVALKETGD